MEFRPYHLDMLLRLLAAVAAGGFIGYERSFHGRPAGLRTHILVACGNALLVVAAAEAGMAARVTQACEDLRSTGTTLGK